MKSGFLLGGSSKKRSPRKHAPRPPVPPAEIDFDTPAKAFECLSAGLGPFKPQLCSTGAVLTPMQSNDWTCGYENLSALLRSLVASGVITQLPPDLSPPGIRALLDVAWAEGFDADAPPLPSNGWIGAMEMLAIMLHLRIDAIVVNIVGDTKSQADDPKAQRGAGEAVYYAVRACLGCTSLPIVLQNSEHSRTILGVTTSPRTVVVRDSLDQAGRLRCLALDTLDGRQHQLVAVPDRGPDGGRLTDEQALLRRDVAPAALWQGLNDGWVFGSTRCWWRTPFGKPDEDASGEMEPAASAVVGFHLHLHVVAEDALQVILVPKRDGRYP
eukprot:4439603-Prymnesium_polylepis.1